jgi:S-adenosylmethionine/arginine decarboxylase-like enzyme
MTELGHLVRRVGSGTSAVLLIDTSHMAVHVWESTREWHFQVSSCKEFSARAVLAELEDRLGQVRGPYDQTWPAWFRGDSCPT